MLNLQPSKLMNHIMLQIFLKNNFRHIKHILDYLQSLWVTLMMFTLWLIRGNEWGSSTKNCNSEQVPLSGSTYPAGLPPPTTVVNKVLGSIKTQVYLLDITFLSQLRKDAHPSAYSGQHPGNDCSHWCLPGLPDTWNQLLYASLVM